ncbi:MAG: sirohydrochlorin chelatase [Candidatus Omnitrophota bacterium]
MRNGEKETMNAALLVAHGTSNPAGREEFVHLAELFQRQEPKRIVEYGFLEKTQPDILSAIGRCAEQGAQNIAAIPCFLGAGKHAALDIPGELNKSRTLYPGLEFRCGEPIPLHPKIIELCRLRIEEAERKAGEEARSETLLLVLGGGSLRKEGNADVFALTRILMESMDFGGAETGFLASVSPSMAQILEHAPRLGLRRILVFPYLLFHGVLFNRARTIIRCFAEKTGTKTILSEPLNAHPLLCEALRQIHREILSIPD